VDGVTAFGNFIYGVSALGSQYSTDFFEAITPAAYPTESAFPTIIPGEITNEQINYFDAILKSCERTDVRCGMSIAIATCCLCYHLETKEGKRRANTVIMGRNFMEYDNEQAQKENNNFTKTVISAGGAVASMMGNPVLGSTIGAASQMFNDEQQPIGYGQIRNPAPESRRYTAEEPIIKEIQESPTKGSLVRRTPYTYTSGGKRKINKKTKTNTKKTVKLSHENIRNK
jgi:hypothetical protein